MAPRSKISNEDRMRALVYHEQGFSLRQIAGIINRPNSCIHNIIQRFKETNSISDRHRCGRPTISTPRDDRTLMRLVKKNRQSPSQVLAQQWKLSSGNLFIYIKNL